MKTELHRAWIRRLRHEWGKVNTVALDGALRPPVFRISAGNKRLGQWQLRGRILSIAEEHIWEDPWEVVVDTLLHEMAHQVAQELMGAVDEPHHGPTWRRACEMIGIEPEVRGRLPGAGDGRADRTLERIRKLLALASSSNEHEAQAAMAKANTLLLQYNLELPDDGVPPGYAHRLLGRSAAAIPLQWKLIAAILEEFFFVECLWVGTFAARRGREERQLEICGTEANLDFAEHVHGVLFEECDRLWKREKARRRKVARTARREYVTGLLTGFSDKLRAERSTNEERGLIWVGDPGLQQYFRQRHPRTVGLRSGAVYMTGAYHSGHEAGRKLTVHRPIKKGPSGGKKLLGG